MASADLLLLAAACVMLAVAAAIDLRTRLIPNWLTMPAILAGAMALSIRCKYGYPALQALAVSAASLFIACLPWLADAWGGGDAKACLAVLLIAGPAFPGVYFAIAFAGAMALLLTARHLCRRPPENGYPGKPPLGPWLLAAYLIAAGTCTACFGGGHASG